MGNCASSRGHSGILDVNVSTQPDCVDALPGDATLDTDKSSSTCEDAYAGGVVTDSVSRPGAAVELHRLHHCNSRDVGGSASLMVGPGSSTARISGGGANASGGTHLANGNVSQGLGRTGSGGVSYGRCGSRDLAEVDALLALSKQLSAKLPACSPSRHPSRQPPQPQQQPHQQQSRSASSARVLQVIAAEPDADGGGGGGADTARLEARGGVNDMDGGGFSPQAYRRQNLSMPALDAGTAGGCLVNDVEDVEDVEEHELAVEAVVAEPGIASRRGAAQAAPPRSHSTGTLVAQQQAHQAAGTWGGSLLSPAIPHPAATPVIACSQAGSPTPAAGSPFNGAASIAAAAMGSYASGPLASSVARMQVGVSRSSSVGVQVTTGSAAAPPAAAVTANGGRRFLGKARPQVDLAAQPKRPALKGSPLSGAAHSLFRPPSCAPDISMTEVQALPATAPTPQQPQQPPSARLGGMRVGLLQASSGDKAALAAAAAAAGGVRAGEALSLPTRLSDLKLQTSPGNLGDYDGSHELLGTIQQPAAAAALSTSLDGGAIQSSSTTGAGASTAAAAPAPAEGRQLQPPALATRLRVQTQQGRAAAGQPACDELLPGSPSARAAACAQQQEPPQQLPQHVISLGQVTASMLASPSSSALTGSCWREALSSPRASPRASGRVHPAPPPAALAADSSSPISSRRQQAGSFQRASSTYPCSSPTDAAPPPATRHQQQSLYDSTGAGATLTAHALGAFSPVQGAVGAQVGVGGSRIGSPHAAPGAGGGGGTGQKLVAELRAISGQLPSSVEAAEKGPSAAGGFLDDLPGGVPDDEE